MESTFYRKDFESMYAYNKDIDYDKEVEEYNSLLEAGERETAKEILKRNGGIISLIMKRQYQRDTALNNTTN